jgi:hypothetical protein
LIGLKVRFSRTRAERIRLGKLKRLHSLSDCKDDSSDVYGAKM